MWNVEEMAVQEVRTAAARLSRVTCASPQGNVTGAAGAQKDTCDNTKGLALLRCAQRLFRKSSKETYTNCDGETCLPPSLP
jgi:hypothetical protein